MTFSWLLVTKSWLIRNEKYDQFPVMQCLARDLLAVPASSVQSERENSKAKYVITDVRNRLSSQTVQASLCLKSWNVLLSSQPLETIVLDWPMYLTRFETNCMFLCFSKTQGYIFLCCSVYGDVEFNFMALIWCWFGKLVAEWVVNII